MSISPIEWTEQTWNPIVGCSLKSPGCTNCYAMAMAARIEAMNAAARPGHETAPHYAGTTKKVNGRAVWTGKIAFASDEVLLAPLKRKKPTVYFVNSMGDLFHEDCPDAWIDRVFDVMESAHHHVYQVLTKRAQRQKDYVIARVAKYPFRDRQHIWLGVSTERQQEADERIPELLRTPAAVHFISYEPALGPLDLEHIEAPDKVEGERWTFNCLQTGDMYQQHDDLGYTSAGDGPYRDAAIDWVIVGGESGPNARPMHPDWACSLRDQCAAADVKFFFKQWGRWSPTHPEFPLPVPYAVANDGTAYFSPDIAYPDGKRYGEALRAGHDKAHLTSMYPIGKARAGKLLDSIEHQAMPEIRRSAP